MSFNIRAIREVPNDPFAKFATDLSKKLSKFITKNETDKLENKEDIYSNGQDLDVVIKFHSELSSTKYFDFATQYFPPTEPDNDKVKLYLRGHNLGNEEIDISGFSNTAYIRGDPILVDGTPFDYGIHTGGVKSIALRLNRPTSDLVNAEYIPVVNTTNLELGSTGMSWFIRFKLHSLAQQSSLDRTLFSKIDDSVPNNGVTMAVKSDGAIRVTVKRAGTSYNWETAAGTIVAGTVYEVWLTYTNSGNVVHVYVNNVDKTLSAGSELTWRSDLGDESINIGRRGLNGGYAYMDFYDYWLLKDKIVSSTEVSRHYTNKWTLANIPFGQVAITNYYATYIDPPLGSGISFTATSFTSTSFTM